MSRKTCIHCLFLYNCRRVSRILALNLHCWIIFYFMMLNEFLLFFFDKPWTFRTGCILLLLNQWNTLNLFIRAKVFWIPMLTKPTTDLRIQPGNTPRALLRIKIHISPCVMCVWRRNKKLYAILISTPAISGHWSWRTRFQQCPNQA